MQDQSSTDYPRHKTYRSSERRRTVDDSRPVSADLHASSRFFGSSPTVSSCTSAAGCLAERRRRPLRRVWFNVSNTDRMPAPFRIVDAECRLVAPPVHRPVLFNHDVVLCRRCWQRGTVLASVTRQTSLSVVVVVVFCFFCFSIVRIFEPWTIGSRSFFRVGVAPVDCSNRRRLRSERRLGPDVADRCQSRGRVSVLSRSSLCRRHVFVPVGPPRGVVVVVPRSAGSKRHPQQGDRPRFDDACRGKA